MGILTAKVDERDESKGESNEIVSNKKVLLGDEKEEVEEEVIDERLVEEARKLLKEDWKKNGNEYSEKHYADLVDENFPHTCWRYITHREYNVENAVELMKMSLKWRKENRADDCRNSEFAKEFWFHCPVVWTGVTKNKNEDVLYVIAKHYRKAPVILKPIVKDYLTNTIFQWDVRNKHNLKKYVVAFDIAEYGYANTDIDLIRWVMSIKDYFPSRISVIYVVGIPYLRRPFIKLLISWLPSNYRDLIKCGSFEELVAKNIGPESLPSEVGGSSEKGYLAPIEAPWMVDLPSFMVDEIQEAMQETFWFHVSEERWNQRRSQQIDFEAQAQAQAQVKSQ